MASRSSASPRTCATSRRRSRATPSDYGLDFFPIIFEVLDYKTMNEVAAYGGFPTRYPHWRFGMDYEQLSKSYEYGLSKIYEMVINTNPAYAYLLEGNSLDRPEDRDGARLRRTSTSSRTTSSSRKTNRKMIDGMANHAARVRRHMARWGQDVVEDFIDTLPVAREPDRSDVAVHRAQRATPKPRRGRATTSDERRRKLAREGLHGLASSTRPSSSRRRGRRCEDEKQEARSAVPRAAAARRAAVPARARAARALAARRARDRPRRGLLLRAAGADEDHERGLGLVLALEDHDREGADRRRDHRLRRRALGRAGDVAGPAQPVQARRRAVPQHRGALEQGPVRQGVGRVRRSMEQKRNWDRRSAWAARRSSRSASSTTTSRSSTSSSRSSSASSRSSTRSASTSAAATGRS